MNMDLRICYIKNELRYSNVSLEYFIKCFGILSNIIKMEDYRGALAFANTLRDATVLLNVPTEQKVYFRYFNNLKETITNLEDKLQTKVIKVR